ncbi:hypothetical protein K1719_036899 [Acacia pycnantha]|nr:hypothetical protein K1719_036899 [Acacia pycnantha]
MLKKEPGVGVVGDWNTEDSKQLVELRREMRFFDHIPKDVLETICDTLSIKDQFRFARVCKLAHSLIYKRANPTTLDTPWLIGLTSSSLFETSYDDQVISYKIGTRPFKYYAPSILGYYKGWIYVHYTCDNFIQLVNLFIDVQIDLPPLSTMVIPKFKYHVLYARAFALSLCKFMRPIMIAIVDQYGDLALCKTNGGSTWKDHEHHCRHYANVTFYHEKLYAMRMTLFQTVDIFKVGDDDLRLFPVGVFAFEVFKVERDGDEFVRMNDLGDQIILLSDSYSEIIDVKNCSTSDVFKGNQICFKGRFYNDVGIYSLKYGTTIWEYPNKGLKCRQWIFPRFITSTECNCESH